jgi:hypothetical protein
MPAASETLDLKGRDGQAVRLSLSSSSRIREALLREAGRGATREGGRASHHRQPSGLTRDFGDGDCSCGGESDPPAGGCEAVERRFPERFLRPVSDHPGVRDVPWGGSGQPFLRGGRSARYRAAVAGHCRIRRSLSSSRGRRTSAPPSSETSSSVAGSCFEGNTLKMYYGAADTSVCYTEIPLADARSSLNLQAHFEP